MRMPLVSQPRQQYGVLLCVHTSPARFSATNPQNSRPATAQSESQPLRGRWPMSAAAMVPLIQARQAWETPKREKANKSAETGFGGTAFYRKRTERLLRRYMQASMEMGRTPSLIGNAIFRGRVSSYRMRTFEDCIIFVFDVEKCLKRLDAESQELIARIALQEYTYDEAAKLTHQSERTVGRKYASALDCLTDLLIDAEILDLSLF